MSERRDTFRPGYHWVLPVLVFWLALWWGIITALGIGPDLMPSPLEVLRSLIRLVTHPVGEGPLSVHILTSLGRFLGGFALAVVIGVPLGFLMGQFRLFDWVLNPIFEFLRYVPPIAWAPFAILWFGASFGAQAFVIFISTLPPVLISAYTAMRAVDPKLIAAARTLGAKPATMILEIGVPSSIPVLVGGLKIGVATGWMALIAAEIVAGTGTRAGLGYLVLIGQQTLQASVTIGAMVVIGLLGWAFDITLRLLERAVMPWR
jgi:ABC-type nitrate/sulfonate/bicarbonate transport system permease component